MKVITIKMQTLLLCGVLITGLMSSCSSEDNVEGGGQVIKGEKTLTLTINTPNTTNNNGAKTRATNMTSNSTEDKINLLTIGIFNSTGTTVRTIQELSSSTTANATGTFNTVSGTSKATLVTNSLNAGDIVLVAANAPSGTFNGCTTVTDFETKKTIAIDAALATSADGTSSTTDEAKDNIPMYGTGTIAAPTTGTTTYTSSVAVQHQLAKITVKSVKVDFDQNGPYKSATFRPTSFFLLNVPNTLAFSKDAWTGSTSFLHGWAAANTGTTPTNGTFKEYLGTGIFSTSYNALKYSTVASDNTIEPGSLFYTIPNSDATNNTKLVIGGEFDADGTGTTASSTTVYYPVNINWVYDSTNKTSAAATNGGTTAKCVYPNKNYICSVVIKTIGSTSPSGNLDPEDVSVTVTVTGFTDVSQETTFE